MKSDPPFESAALVARSADAPDVWDDVRLQKLWLATQRKEWRSLAIVGGSKGIETLSFADMLSKIAWWYCGQPSSVFDLRDLRLRLVDYHLREIESQIAGGVRVVIALRSMFENPTAIPIARAADAVVVCVDLGKTAIKSAEQTIDAVGHDRVLGSIVIRNRRTPKTAGAA